MAIITSCPVCVAEMKEITKNNIQIDVCTQCRGVWLDRGELEKLLSSVRETVTNEDQPMAVPHGYQQQRSYPNLYDRPRRDRYDDDDDYRYGGEKRSYKKSKIERIFDIFD